VIEWAERWLGEDQGPKSEVQSLKSKVTSHPQRVCRVQIEVLSETQRRFTYEDPRA
jgi:hypothetical protein